MNGRRVSLAGARDIRAWLRASGFRATDVRPLLSPRRERATKMAFGTLRNALATRFLVRATVR
jgi:hypothetical protein